MGVHRDVHGGTGGNMAIPQRALERELTIVPGNRTVQSSEHPCGIARWRTKIRVPTLIRDKALRGVVEVEKPCGVRNPGRQVFSANHNVRPFVVHYQSAVSGNGRAVSGQNRLALIRAAIRLRYDVRPRCRHQEGCHSRDTYGLCVLLFHVISFHAN